MPLEVKYTIYWGVYKYPHNTTLNVRGANGSGEAEGPSKAEGHSSNFRVYCSHAFRWSERGKGEKERKEEGVALSSVNSALLLDAFCSAAAP